MHNCRSYLSSLCLAGYIFAPHVDSLLQILVSSGDDQLRYRVSKTLATPTKVTILGREAVKQFAQGTRSPPFPLRSFQLLSYSFPPFSPPGRVTYLYRSARASLACAWFFGFLLHDDPEAIRFWVAERAKRKEDDPENEVIETIFRCMSKITDQSFTTMLQILEEQKDQSTFPFSFSVTFCSAFLIEFVLSFISLLLFSTSLCYHNLPCAYSPFQRSRP